LFFDHHAFEFSAHHFAGVTVHDVSESIPRQRALTRRVTVTVAQSRPTRLLRDAAKAIPNKRFSILATLITRRACAIGAQ
jgi:hypothetical protein